MSTPQMTEELTKNIESVATAINEFPINSFSREMISAAETISSALSDVQRSLVDVNATLKKLNENLERLANQPPKKRQRSAKH